MTFFAATMTLKLTFETYDKKELGQPKLKFTQLQHFFKLTLECLHGWVKRRREIHTRFEINVPAPIRFPVNKIGIHHYINRFDLIVPIDQM